MAYMLLRPAFVPQPKTASGAGYHPHCWAAALASWLAICPGRTPIPMQDLIANLKQFTVLAGDGALKAGKFDQIADLPAIRMAWRPISGSDFIRWDQEILLQTMGHVYVVCQPLSGGMAHARVMYGTNDVYKTSFFVDPMKDAMSWGWPEMANFRLIIGVTAETCPNWDKNWIMPGT